MMALAAIRDITDRRRDRTSCAERSAGYRPRPMSPSRSVGRPIWSACSRRSSSEAGRWSRPGADHPAPRGRGSGRCGDRRRHRGLDPDVSGSGFPSSRLQSRSCSAGSPALISGPGRAAGLLAPLLFRGDPSASSSPSTGGEPGPSTTRTSACSRRSRQARPPVSPPPDRWRRNASRTRSTPPSRSEAAGPASFTTRRFRPSPSCGCDSPRPCARIRPPRGTSRAAVEQIDGEIEKLRRLITELRPAALDTIGLEAALQASPSSTSRLPTSE